MNVRNLTPTQSALILSPYKIKGKLLITLAIQEMILLKLFFIEQQTIKDEKIQTLQPNTNHAITLNEYQTFIWKCAIKFNCDKTITNTSKNILTTSNLTHNIYNELEFKGIKFKWEYVFPSINKRLVNSKFPHYYIFNLLTQAGRRIKHRLNQLLKKLSDKRIGKVNSPEIIEILKELGLNILLLNNLREIKTKINDNTVPSIDNYLSAEIAINSIELIGELIQFDLLDFDFDFPDLGDIPFPDLDF